MNPIAIRLLSQQLICPQKASPKEVVAHMGAVQAQDYRMMRWAVMMRMKKPSVEAFRQAYDAGEIIRLHLLRGTWQLVSADDYGWMLRLFAEKSERVIRGWMKSNKVFIDDDELYAIREILVETCERKLLKDHDVLGYGSATREDFAKSDGWAMNSTSMSHVGQEDSARAYLISCLHSMNT